MRWLGWAALWLGILGGGFSGVRGDVLVERLNERRGDVVVSGETFHDPTAAAAARRPGILLLDDAADTTEARRLAGSWARSGRVVLRLDRPEAGQDRSVRTRAEIALAILRRDARVDGRDLAIVGYNSFAPIALGLATSGLAIDGVACVGGDPEPPSAEAVRRIRSRVLLVARPGDPTGRRRDLENVLRHGEVDWQAVREGEADPSAAVEAFLNRLWSPTTLSRRDESATPSPNNTTATAKPRPTPTTRPPATTTTTTTPRPEPKPKSSRPASRLPSGVPAKVAEVLAHVDATGEAMDGYVGGRTFVNAERRLPQNDRQGRRIRYREWDVNPLRPGVNRGAERLVTGNDGSAYFTSDHYESFRRIR